MPNHLSESDSLTTHIESLSYFTGALEQSPGNGDLVATADSLLERLLDAQHGQGEVSHLDQRQRGARFILLLLMGPIVRELEKVEKAYIASPAGKNWTPMFGATAASILQREAHDSRDAALAHVDATVTRADCPAVFKDAGKRFHDLHKRYVAVGVKQQQNDVAREDGRQVTASTKLATSTFLHQAEGTLKSRRPDDLAFVDAHFKPAPPKRKKDDPKLEELQKKNADLTAQLADAQQKNDALLALVAEVHATNDGLQRQLNDAMATAEAFRQQLADVQAHAAATPVTEPSGSPTA